MNKKRINLEGIFYDEEGNFLPRVSRNGNISSSLASLRNTFMEAERAYFEELLSNPVFVERFKHVITDYSSSELFAFATYLQDKLENGELETSQDRIKMQTMTPEERDAFHMQKLEDTETIITLLFAAASDKAKVREKVLIREKEEEIYHTRSR